MSPSRTRPAARPRLLAVGATCLALMSAAIPSATASALPVAASTLAAGVAAPPAAQFQFRTQRLRWKPCAEGSTAQCATFKVPLDYQDPTGPRIRIAVSRQKATGPSRLGSIVFDPGGPGGSGTEFIEKGVEALPAGLRESFDLIGLDPRGVGRSTQINCMTQSAYDNRTTGLPTDLESRQAFIEALQDVPVGCEQLSPGMMAHVGTRDAARDMDILRSVLGERRLNYLGVSYGTYLGAVYASLFGDRVGRFVLDANMDPSIPIDGLGKGQARGFQDALQRWADVCAATQTCGLPGTSAEVIDALSEGLRRVNTSPIPVADGQDVSFEETLQVVMTGLTIGREGWPLVTLAALAVSSQDGSHLRQLMPTLAMSRNMFSANTAINCYDRPAEGSQELARKRARTWRAFSPTFAAFMAWGSIGCGWWPERDPQGPGDIPISGVPPILLFGGTHDPNTPLQWTYAMQDKLPGSRVVVWDDDGHGASTKGNTCINETLTDFFVHARLPRDGKQCS